ncbi:MAG TPA: cupin domain-containing protein [Bacteroidales bacterium]|nr:cupin domain-containing protein [Bacteroidales bacterium]
MKIRDTKESDLEIVDTLCNYNKLQIKRIVSKGQVTPPGVWLSQRENEWVILLRGKASLEFEFGERLLMKSGDYYFIPAGLKHRVTYTSKRPICVWLAVHFK